MSGQVTGTGSRVVYHNSWMTVREDDVRYANGSTGLYGVVDKPDYALVIPRDGERLHLVEQYRYPVGGRYWEFPQGSWPSVKDDRSAVELARHELREETGLSVARLIALGRVHVAYGYSTQACHVFLAEGLREGEPVREATESDMSQGWFDPRELGKLVASGRISDSATLAALTLLDLHDHGDLEE